MRIKVKHLISVGLLSFVPLIAAAQANQSNGCESWFNGRVERAQKATKNCSFSQEMISALQGQDSSQFEALVNGTDKTHAQMGLPELEYLRGCVLQVSEAVKEEPSLGDYVAGTHGASCDKSKYENAIRHVLIDVIGPKLNSANTARTADQVKSSF